MPLRGLIGIALVCFPWVAYAEDAESQGHRVSLFDGESLDGWHVLGCEASVEDGHLVIVDGDGFIRSDHRYRDFVLELSWRARRGENWDSGIYIRSELPEGRPWPKRYQVNLKEGDEGNLIGFPKARSEGLVKAGQWNRFKLTVIGETASMEINGQAAWETDGVEHPEGYVGLQVEVPGGGQFEFKDISITEVGHQSLFNGRDLAGWEGGGQDAALCWKVGNGVLLCTGEKGPWLRSDHQYRNFNLRLEYKLKEGGNSGVYLRVAKNGSHRYAGEGIEVQILDDKAKRYGKLKPYQFSGSVYAIAASQQHVGRAPGEWNSLEIDCDEYRYRVTHNGVVIVDATGGKFPALTERRLAGYLGLQNHSEEVAFRNLRVRGEAIDEPASP